MIAQAAKACLALVLCLIVTAGAALAERAAQLEALFEALKIRETVEIMQAEGDAYAASLAESMMLETDAAAWSERVARIYDADKMYAVIAGRIDRALGNADLAAILAYYETDGSARVGALELSARRALLDPETEALAHETYAELAADGDSVIADVETIIADSDLIERNLSGALNAELMLYRGLGDGGAIELSEAEILDDVWAREEELRAWTGAWLRAFMVMAYRPLEVGDRQDYIAFWRSPAGRDLNRAVFAGYDRMYEEISYLLGLAVAEELRGQDL